MTEAGKVLVLGASGFFGGWIVRELEGSGHDVVAANRETGADLLDPAGLRQLIAATRPAKVINAAGVSSPAAAAADPAACLAVNTGGMANLLEAIRQEAPAAGLLALSSAAVYKGEPPFDEKSPTVADTIYAASKLSMEVLCGQYSRQHGQAITVLRSFNLVGPGEPPGQATSEFTRTALSASPGEQVEIEVGDPETARDFTDVRDAARAVRLVVDRNLTGTFNVCSGRPRSLTDIAAVIARISGRPISLVARPGKQRRGEPSRSWGSNRRLEEATGWQPEIAIEDSLTELMEAHG